MDKDDNLQPSSDETTTRRTFVKTGATVTGGLLLTGVYSKPSLQSINLSVLPNPSSASPGQPGKKPENPGKPKNPGKPENPGKPKNPGKP